MSTWSRRNPGADREACRNGLSVPPHSPSKGRAQMDPEVQASPGEPIAANPSGETFADEGWFRSLANSAWRKPVRSP
jgi:hypothetical protein